ncbi:serine/threonine-protein phosphatase 7 long form-like protein [Senna tora]|uniref:Serine/threonine-protein phosphatase 7 long form-like protein n=1 Tax=Senna tora TaxID=362788 RepID=A0A834ST81_9FABA|nr:serine/threonine-protein phosphatase 7 long form-like protein [Senna tora]
MEEKDTLNPQKKNHSHTILHNTPPVSLDPTTPFLDSKVWLFDWGYSEFAMQRFVVTGTEKHNYRELCMELLGIELPQQRQTRKGQRVSMSWLKSQFQYVPDHNSPEVYKQRYTRQYILHLLGGYLIPDKTSTDCCLMYLPLLRDFAECGQYSWGSAVLGTLYRELCKVANPDTRPLPSCPYVDGREGVLGSPQSSSGQCPAWSGLE